MSSTEAKKPSHLVIYTHVSHHKLQEQLVAHSGFVLEVNIWAKIFEKVTVVAPFSEEKPQADAIPYEFSNIHYHQMGISTSLDGLSGKIKLLLSLATWLNLGKQALQADSVIMARGPGSHGMVGALLALIYGYPRFAKYADQLMSYPGENWGTKIQRGFLKSKFFGGPVLVYGDYDPSKPHLVPLNLPLSITAEEWETAGQALATRPSPPPYQLLFVGRLSPFKRIDLLLEAIKILDGEGYDIQLNIVGDGDTRSELENLSQNLGLTKRVFFRGWLNRSAVFEFYQNSHCLVNCSVRQGIDKVLIEAMTHALPIVSSDVNIVRLILEPPRCGLLYQIANLEQLIKQLRQVINNPNQAHEMGLQGRFKTQTMQIDHLEKMYRAFIRQHLNIDC